MISFEDAIQIAAAFAKEIDGKFPDKIKAVFAIGSLGSDYCRPGQSDIDTAVITAASRAELACLTAGIQGIAQTYQSKYNVPKGFGAIVFAEEQLYPPYRREEELVQEILRLKTQARRIYGEYDLKKIPMPDRNAIKEDILCFQEWSDAQPPFEHSATSFVNSTLIALKRYLLLKHRIIEFNKFKVIALYKKNAPVLVNEKVFAFIEDYLHGRPYEWNAAVRAEFVMWHDALYRAVNDEVLYNKQDCHPQNNGPIVF